MSKISTVLDNVQNVQSNQFINISSPTNFINVFGEPNNENIKSWYNIYSFLTNSNTDIDIYVPPSNITNKMLTISETVIPIKSEAIDCNNDIKMSTYIENLNIATNQIKIIEKHASDDNDIAIIIISNDSAFYKPISNEIVEKIISKSIHNPNELTEINENDTYIVNDGTGEWLGHNGELAIYSDGWNFSTKQSNTYYFILDEDLEYYFDGLSLDTHVHSFGLTDKNDYFIKDTYKSSLINSNGTIKSPFDLLSVKPDFTEDIILFVLIKENDKFKIAETFIENTEFLTDFVNEKSNLIQIKSLDIFNLNNSQLSISHNSLEKQNIVPIIYDYDSLEIDFNDYDIFISSPIKYENKITFTKYDLFLEECNDNQCMFISGIWDYEPYLSYNLTSTLDNTNIKKQIINDFGIINRNEKYSISTNNLIIVNNFTYYENSFGKKYIVPLYGIVAANILNNLNVSNNYAGYNIKRYYTPLFFHFGEDIGTADIFGTHKILNIINDNGLIFTNQTTGENVYQNKNQIYKGYAFNLIKNKLTNLFSNVTLLDINYGIAFHKLFNIINNYLESIKNIKQIDDYKIDFDFDLSRNLGIYKITLNYNNRIEMLVNEIKMEQ